MIVGTDFDYQVRYSGGIMKFSLREAGRLLLIRGMRVRISLSKFQFLQSRVWIRRERSRVATLAGVET